MNPRVIWDYAEAQGLVPDKGISGKTPFQTLKSKISTHIRRYGDSSLFIRTAPGKFFLRELLKPGQEPYAAKPLEPPGRDEKVLSFPTHLLDKLGRFQGISKHPNKLYRRLLRRELCTHIPRAEAELNNQYKQVVTYSLVTRGNALLAFRRGNYTRTDKFLRGSHCVGFGGHVVEDDLTLFNYGDMGVSDSAVREIAEELNLPEDDRMRISRKEGFRLMAALNDDSSDVGRRHFAFIFRYEVLPTEEWVKKNWEKERHGEKAVTNLRWLEPSGKDFSMRDFEYWSQLCMREYYPNLVKGEPSYLIRRCKYLTPPHILCVLGPVGSGKTEATSILKKGYGYREINTGKLIAALIGMPPVPKTPRGAFQKEAFKFITSVDGPRLLAYAVQKQVASVAADRILIDGFRNVSTVREFRKLLGSKRVALLYVHTPPDIAFRFAQGRPGGPKSIDDFLLVRESPVEKEVEQFIAQADAVLYNWTGKNEYRATIRRMMSELGVH